jgi:hypothetical protein
LIGTWIRDLRAPMNLGLSWWTLCGPYRFMGTLFTLLNLQMAHRLIPLMSSGLQEGAAQIHMSEWRQSFHSHRMWAKVSSSAPHLLHSGLPNSPSRWRCLLRALCPLRRPVTDLDCVLLEDRNLALAPREGPKISSQACFWVLPRPLLCTQHWWTNRQLILLRISCLDSQGQLRSKKL